jgi:hypothetical protein
MEHYTYLYLREDGSPYYVGKGQGRRAYIIQKWHKPPKDHSKITLQYWVDEDTALAYERYQIDFWGRKDIGSGILINHTDGGDEPPSHKGKSQSESHKKKIGDALRGKPKSKASRTNMSIARIGTSLSEETKKRMSESHMGRQVSEETRRKISEANKGKQLGNKNWRGKPSLQEQQQQS